MNKEVYFSNLEWNRIKDTKIGGVKGNVIFKGGISYEEYNKLLKNTYYLICSKDYIIDLQKENEQLTISLSAQEELTMNEYTKKDKYKKILDKIKDKINQLKKEHNKNNEIALDKLVYNTLELNEILELLEEIE